MGEGRRDHTVTAISRERVPTLSVCVMEFRRGNFSSFSFWGCLAARELGGSLFFTVHPLNATITI